MEQVIKHKDFEYTLYGNIDEYSDKILIFMFHGSKFASKSLRRNSEAFVKANNKVVAVLFDAKDYGSRYNNKNNKCTPNEIYKTIVNTALEAQDILNDILDKYKNKWKNFICGTFGLSMGGHTAIMFTGIEKRVTFCISLMGCGDYTNLAKIRDNIDIKKVDINPMNNIESYRNKYLLFSYGSMDNIVPQKANNEFYDGILNLANVNLKLYNVGHKLSKNMWRDSLEWFKKNIN